MNIIDIYTKQKSTNDFNDLNYYHLNLNCSGQLRFCILTYLKASPNVGGFGEGSCIPFLHTYLSK